jgi:hypothetical protein
MGVAAAGRVSSHVGSVFTFARNLSSMAMYFVMICMSGPMIPAPAPPSTSQQYRHQADLDHLAANGTKNDQQNGKINRQTGKLPVELRSTCCRLEIYIHRIARVHSQPL